MTDESNPERVLTKGEIEDARGRASVRMKQLADEYFGTDEELRKRSTPDNLLENMHGKKTFVHKIDVLTNLFFSRNKQAEQFNITSFFDFIREAIAPKRIRNGIERSSSEDDIREYHAAAEQLLIALNLRKEFQDYNRSLKSIGIEGGR